MSGLSCDPTCQFLISCPWIYTWNGSASNASLSVFYLPFFRPMYELTKYNTVYCHGNSNQLQGCDDDDEMKCQIFYIYMHIQK